MLNACFLSFSTGFLALCMEILWVRLFGFANESLPQAFAFVLVFFLVGIALGAEIGRRICKAHHINLWLASGVVLLLASLVDISGPWIYAYFAETKVQLWCGSLLITLTSLFTAIVFPIAHHLGTPQSGPNIGRKLSKVYVSNIVGATLGPIFLTFILLNIFITQACFVLIATFTFLLSMFCLIGHLQPRMINMVTILASVIIGSFIFFPNGNWLINKTAAPYGKLARIIENPYGIITIYNGGKDDDVIAGGNVYDGRTNLDPLVNTNGINRVLVLAALNDHPKNILMIGLSIGTWLKLVTSFPGVENIDVIEINPGYIKAIEAYPRQQSALEDPRVHVYIDDGRRWLKTHAEKKYDLVIMNTTYHWRAYSSDLLSREFLQLIKQHMKTDAVMSYNTTGSLDALKTADSVFKYSFLYQNFAVVADFDWRKKLYDPAAIKKLSSLQMDGKRLFPLNSNNVIKSFLNLKVMPLAAIEPFYAALGRKIEIVTDQNLITEYKYGRSLKK